MDEERLNRTVQSGMTRRNVMRKAAYSTPAVVAIAAAPHAALAGSGPKKFPPPKPNPKPKGGK